nr:hypothetical protein Iba_chr08dCG2680 [Ipomoea batatas]
MVSELAGEGAMPLPKPASRAELQVRLRRQIRRGSSLRRGVFPANTFALFNPSIVFTPLSLDGSSRSRSVEISSRVLVNPLFAVFNPTSWSRSVKRSSAELVNPLFDSVCVQSLSVNPLFIASRSRSVERTSTTLDYQPRVCAVEIAQSMNFIFACVSRSRRGEQPVLDSDSENGEGSPKDSNTRFLAVFNPSRVLVNAVFAVLDRDS